MSWIKENKVLAGLLALGAVIGIVSVIIYFATREKAPVKNELNCDPNKCDPNNKGLDMCGDFSVPCAGGTPPAFVCATDEHGINTGYDTKGNFNVLCAGSGRIQNNFKLK